MNFFTLKLRDRPPGRVDASSLCTALITSPSELALATTRLPCGRERIPIGELFSISSGNASEARIEGDLSRFDRIGESLRYGTIHIEGSVGDMLGAAMRGGQITVAGDAGNLTAGDMRGGTIVITGSTGDEAGGPLRGSTKGMRGGILKVTGNAGDRVGYRMRRGTISVRGNCGNDMALGMIAGTIAVMGNVGHGSGRGMKRGTILTLRSGAPSATVSHFSLPYETDLIYLNLLFAELPEWKSAIEAIGCRATHVHRRIGDLLAGGQGEWLTCTDITMPVPCE